MPRDGSGIYQKASASFVANTTITSSSVNANLDDLVNDANTARPITAGGTGAQTAAAALIALGALAKAGDTMTGDLSLGGHALAGITTLNGGPLSSFRNKLINGDGAIIQRALTSASNNTYGFDRHMVRTQTAAVGLQSMVGAYSGYRSVMRLTQSQATAQRMGQSQVLEFNETVALRGKTVTLGGKATVSGATTNLRFAIVEFTGTADAPGTGLVNDWTSGTYTAGNFFASTNLIVRAVGVKTLVVSSLTDFSLTATVGSTATNLILFYWSESALAQGVVLDARWYLVEGDATAEVDPFSPRHIAQELALCQRYYEKSFDSTIAPAQNSNSSIGAISFVAQITSQSFDSVVAFKVQKRAIPTLTTYSTNAASSNWSTNTDSPVSSVASATLGVNGVAIRASSPLTAGHAYQIHWTAEAEL